MHSASAARLAVPLLGRPPHTHRLQDALSSVMAAGGGELEGEGVSFPKIILRPHFKKEKPKAFWRSGDEGGR